ncbi:hypothetical protein L53_13740 [Hyphomonas sp. L-53-1-40]|nr:hypothetical protein L53_13740 [Hyphomonas sp. L-53-1-40]
MVHIISNDDGLIWQYLIAEEFEFFIREMDNRQPGHGSFT